jgi:hypothetical protein
MRFSPRDAGHGTVVVCDTGRTARRANFEVFGKSAMAAVPVAAKSPAMHRLGELIQLSALTLELDTGLVDQPWVRRPEAPGG